MKEQYKDLGKVSLTVDGYWSANKTYEVITIVNDSNDNSYISKKDVPKGTELTNTEYWQPVGIKTNVDNIKVYKLNILNELTINSEKIIIDEALTPIGGNNIVFPTIKDILLDDENNESSTILFTSKTDAADEGGYFIYYIYKDNIDNKLIIKIINIGGENYDNNIKVLSVNSYDVTSINNFINIAKNITFIASGDGIDSTVKNDNNKVSFKLPWITGEKIIEDGISKDAEFIIPVATTTAAGVISKEDKSKVDTIGTSKDSANPNGTVFARIKDLKNNAVGKKVARGGEIFNNSEYNTANGENSHAEGRGSEANGDASHAEGSSSANGDFSHAEGRANANGNTAHAEGSSIADGDASHAEGYSTNSKGKFSHTEGYYTIANNINEHASGRFNASNTSGSDSNNSWKGNNINTLFSIGNGTKENNRKNAFEVKQDGTILIQKPTTSEVINLQDYLLNRFILRSQKGIAGGVATLDSTGKIPSNQLPAGIDDVKDIIYGSNSLSTLTSSSNWTSAKVGDRGLVYKSSGGTEDGIYVKTNSGYIKEEFQKDLIYVIDTRFTCGDITFNTNTCWRWSGTQLAQTNSGIVIGNVEGTAFDGGKGTTIENDINKLKDSIGYGDLLTPVYQDKSNESTIEFEFKTINKDFETNPIKAVIAINSATTKTAGAMSAADKTKLSELEENKQDKLKSGENIATINNKDITKGGNIYTYVVYNLSFIDVLSTSSSVGDVEQAFSPNGELIKPSVGDVFKGAISDKNIVNGIVTNVYFLPTDPNKITIEYRKKNIFVTLKIDFDTYKVLAKSEWNAEEVIGNSTDVANPNGTIFARLKSKQDTLESGVNIATINGNDITKGNNIVINPTIIDLKWTTNVATTRKLVPEELRAKDVRIAYTNNLGVYIVEKYKVETIDDDSWSNDANWKGCRTSLTPLFENAGAKFNDEIGYYDLNGINNLSENDMYEIYNNQVIIDKNGDIQYRSVNFRTNIVTSSIQFYNMSLEFKFYQCGNLEVVKLSKYFNSFSKAKNLTSTFNGCTKLRNIITIIEVTNDCNYQNAFKGCRDLENVKIKGIAGDISFEDSPLIHYDSLKYIIDNAANTGPITLTVHTTTYDYFQGSLQPIPEVGGVMEEWIALMTQAEEKQISFTTI